MSIFSKETIQVILAQDCIGTVVEITHKRLFRKPVITRYICIKTDRYYGGHWVNAETGDSPNTDLESKLNRVAHNKAHQAYLTLNAKHILS